MSKSITQNNIVFSNVKDKNNGLKIYASGVYIPDGVDSEFGGIVNAVDIDWNAADLQSAVSQASANTSEDLSITGINTTGDLIKVVAEQQAQIKSLSLLVKALYESIVTDSGTTHADSGIADGPTGIPIDSGVTGAQQDSGEITGITGTPTVTEEPLNSSEEQLKP